MKNCFPILLSIVVLNIGLCPAIASDAEVDRKRPALFPAPQSVKWGEVAISVESVKTVIPRYGADSLKGNQLRAEVSALFSKNKVKHSPNATFQINFKLGDVSAPEHWQGQAEESYSLTSGKEGVVITANYITGLYHGLQTLRQLMVHKEGKTTVAACEIHDYPAFKIRGLMHDVGRNFQSIEQLKLQIDVMAAYKMNVFHWHLTDHFGWRLESKKFPELQSEKAFGRHVGKFYTQKEFKDMSDYCWARGITIIPEFDSPGHSEAFRHGLGIERMSDPRALKSMVVLIDELCRLADKKRMPYIHIGTDEVRGGAESVGKGYLPALHKAVQDNDRTVIGWCKGMTFKGAKQVAQTWATSRPWGGYEHIDSRSNYINHMEALDFALRMLFQQPCRAPHGDERNLGGILAYWPDNRVDDEKLSLTNNPVIPSMVAYSEAVWKGIAKDQPEYWAKLPPKGTAEYEAFVDYENRLAEQRDRFLSATPFPMVKTHHLEWRLLGPVADGEVPELEKGVVRDLYRANNDNYRWTKPLHGGAIHIKHFFGFGGHLKTFNKGKDVVWANTYIYSDKNQKLDAWISFNTTSSSDNRAGVAQAGHWNANQLCNIWINDQRVAPPVWKNPGKMGKEFAFTNEIYTSRPPTKISLKKGWNKVLVKSAPNWKWVFSFTPIEWDGKSAREVKGLKYSAVLPKR